MKKTIDRQSLPDIVFHPALTPIEAAMLPAKEPKRGFGALAHARASWRPGAGRKPMFAVRSPKLKNWGPAGK